MPADVSIVIPNWNGAGLLREHVPALQAVLDAEMPGVETIVVDDGSQDDSLEVLRNELPWVRTVVHEINQGFGPACLSGVRAAGSRLVFLLNSDVHVLPGFLSPLLAAFEAEPRLFSAAAVALSEDGVSFHDTLRRPIWSRGNIAFEKLSAEVVSAEFASGAPRPTLFATGGHALVERERFLALGGFSPLYHPFYWEDIDLGYRAWKRGWPTVVVPSSRVIHQDVGTIRTHFEKRGLDDVSRRNRYLFTWQNITSSRMLCTRHLLPLALKILTRWLVADWRFYQVLKSANQRRPDALRGRAEEKAAQVLTDEEVWQSVRS